MHQSVSLPDFRRTRNARKVCYVREQVQHGANREPKRGSDLQGAHRVADVVHDVIHARPSRVRVKNLERGGGVLRTTREYVRSAERRGQRTSKLLVELPAKAFRKFACGSVMEVRPERTTQPGDRGQRLCVWRRCGYLPAMTMKSRMTILNTLRACARRSGIVNTTQNINTYVHEIHPKPRCETMQERHEDDYWGSMSQRRISHATIRRLTCDGDTSLIPSGGCCTSRFQYTSNHTSDEWELPNLSANEARTWMRTPAAW